ncbi:MAG TPA: hypothetical protein VJ505_00315 [Holophagaceae bacterium]|nr:hypothetical protein [Holophagaceae bacterium]
MTPQELKNLSDEEAFDLLYRPEDWPEDPETQAELARMLELHLALEAHGPSLRENVRPLSRWNSTWLAAAAALLVGIVPASYAVIQYGREVEARKDLGRIDQVARARAQERAWASFFTQSSTLVQEFAKNPKLCTADKLEDRSAEREEAQALLEASRQLQAQGARVPEAERTRQDLHQWLQEIALEQGCLDPKRANELRQWASAKDLSDNALRMERRLKGEQP